MRPFMLTCLLFCSAVFALDFADYSVEQARSELPSEADFLTYMTEDLWHFWSTREARQFVSYRCNDGSTVDIKNPCNELRAGWMRDGMGYDFTRMVSRQTYTYGAIYHMTGNEQAFELMLEGVDILLARLDGQGSIATVLKNNQAVYQAEQRTSQDLAYANVGLAMAYYLTGDEALLSVINDIKETVFNRYYREDWGMLAWTLKNQQPGDSQNQELVAQLDQLNAYMLLVYPQLPDAMKAEWEADIRLVVDILMTRFYDAKHQRFAGMLVNDQLNRPGQRHNDFGHTVKTFWMIYTAGQLLNDDRYTEFGALGIASVAERAFRFRVGPNAVSTWANQEYSHNSSWWEFAEMTQATASLALADEQTIRYLPDAYATWKRDFVDSTYGGVYMSAGGDAKQNLWKNGYHEAEIGLVGYITSQMLRDEPITLYFKRSEGYFQPYFYPAEVQSITSDEDRVIVTF